MERDHEKKPMKSSEMRLIHTGNGIIERTSTGEKVMGSPCRGLHSIDGSITAPNDDAGDDSQ